MRNFSINSNWGGEFGTTIKEGTCLYFQGCHVWSSNWVLSAQGKNNMSLCGFLSSPFFVRWLKVLTYYKREDTYKWTWRIRQVYLDQYIDSKSPSLCSAITYLSPPHNIYPMTSRSDLDQNCQELLKCRLRACGIWADPSSARSRPLQTTSLSL